MVAVAVGLTGLTAMVAMVARAPLSRSTPVNGSSAEGPVAALSVLIVGAGIVALAPVLAAAWPARRRKREDEREVEPLRAHWIWKLVAIVVPLVLGATLIAAALLGTKTVRENPRIVSGPVSGRTPGAPAAPGHTGRDFAVPSWLPWTVLAIILVGITAAVLLFLRRRRASPSVQSDAGAARAAVDAAIGVLDTATDPRSAVIAAYAAMVRTLEAHGVARSPSEAPREYLQRVLAAICAAGQETRTLTELFEEARFSTHPVSERVRELALSALSSVRAKLRMGHAG